MMILPLQKVDGHPVGGKARGLHLLRELGLNVPDAFVLLHPRVEDLDDDLIRRHLKELGDGPKAVRSSAVSEDGTEASFAGQFESYLNLHSFEEIKSAITRCLNAVGTERVRCYSGNLTTNADLRISVILQNMIDARVAGVIFTSNPVNHRRDVVVINAVAGQGEELVSGHANAHHYEIYPSGSNIDQEASKNGRLLQAAQIRTLLEGALLTGDSLNAPVDLEWAIDKQGVLHWLQVRPITTLHDVHYNELDTVKGKSNDIWTLGNIGEMMPGVATPLTYSVSAESIDLGMTVLADKYGANPIKNRTSPRYIQMFYNRLFVNMSNMMDYPKRVWMNKAEDVQFSLSGKVFPEITAKPELPFPIRFVHFCRQMISTFKTHEHLKKLRRLEAGFRIDPSGPPACLYRRLGEGIPTLGQGFGHHLMASAQSGTLYAAFMRIMTNDKRSPGPEDHHIATMLLLNIPEIESADAVKSLEKFAGLIGSHRDFAERFIHAGPETALAMLQEESVPEIPARFRAFLRRHGHRCVREAELREKTWGEYPLQLIQTLQSRVRVGEVRHVTHDAGKEVSEALTTLPFLKRTILRSLIPTARKAVARREITKALSIRMVNTLRQGYRVLAGMLVEEGLLDDADQIYFLTHEEIGRLINHPGPDWKARADRRREILPELDRLSFEEISYGIPEPLIEEQEFAVTEGQLRGTPVSSGFIEGPARIINCLADAGNLREGEIMIAAFTDIGWTPYFSLAAGLVTEIGSPLSHGAVVAREYGIPAVVGAKGARKFFTTGEMICLDANKGIVGKK